MRQPLPKKQCVNLLTGLLGVVVLLRLAGCADPSAPSRAGETGLSFDLASSESVVLVGAGDIASCATNQGDEKTAALINTILASDATAQVFAAGDNVYDRGTAAEFANCYDPSWGEFKDRTRPAAGNHEYETSGATPYFNYFGGAAGKPGEGYYSYDMGQWHIVVLNSNISTGVGSAQDRWLKADLASTGKPCVLAYWHHARFRSSATAPVPAPYAKVKPFWDALYAAKADVVLVGHQHFYERFAPMTPAGQLDTQNGIRQFVVGTGGKSTGPLPLAIAPHSQVVHGGKQEFGVLKLTLGSGNYRWDFIPVAGKTFTDTGTGSCHPKGGGGGGTGTIAANAGNNQTATVGTNVATAPSVKVTDAGGNPVADVAVNFAVTQGGGSVTGASQTSNASGIATVASWKLGTTTGSGNNQLTASSAGLTGSPVTFTASATPGPVNASTSTATVPNGTVGSATSIVVQGKDQHGNNQTTGGATVVVTVSGANSATPSVTDNGNGTYSASYTPATAGSDQVAITLNGLAISGSPYTSTVAGGGGASSITLDAGNNQSATVNTAVATAPSVKVTDAGGNPVADVAVSFAITLGGGSLTGAAATTNADGIATVGSWTLGTRSGNNRLTATAAGLTGSPVTFAATGTAGAPTAIAISAGNNQTAPAGTAVPVRPAVKVTDAFGNGVPNVGVTFAVASGGGSLTGASRPTGSGGVATVGSWTLGPTPGPNTLSVTATGAGIANNPVTFTATGN